MDNKTIENANECELQYFHSEGETYVYDFTELRVIQAEYAKEVGEFRYYQQMKEALSFKELVQSKATEWLPLCASYLLVKVVDGVAQKYDESKQAETEKFIKYLPIAEAKRLEGVVVDFFSNIGKSVTISHILQGKGNLLWRQTLLGTALTSMNKS